jgi:DNA polymerase-3 subunit gamma/tau
MLSTNAFNALLKTLEEPPEHVKFIFATTEPHRLPVTILSRCQRFDFKRVTLPKIIARLREIAEKESVTVSDASLALIARKGDGSMRDSLTAFDQVLAFCGNSVKDEDVATLLGTIDRRLLADISAAVFGGDTQGALAGIKQVDLVGYNMRQFCQELIEHFRNLLVIRSVKKPEEILDLAAAELEELQKQSLRISALDVQRRLTLLIKAESEMAYASFPRLIVEMALLKATLLAPLVPIQELIEKIKTLETAAVHTPALPWDATRTVPTPLAPQPGQRSAIPTALPQPTSSAPAAAVSTSAPAPADGQGDWSRFVAFVNGKDRQLGSILEHGSPLKQESGVIEIGFPAGSYYLTAAQDDEFIADVQTLACSFSGGSTAIRVKSIESGFADAPLSLAEKKKSDTEQQLAELKQEAINHPVIKEAERVFGCSISDVRKL